MAKKLALAVSVWCLMVTAVFAQQANGGAVTAAPPLRIGAGDLIQVTIFEDSDLSGNYRVDQNGDVTLLLVGHLHVAGLTADEAGSLIDKTYVENQILSEAGARATVFIAEYASQGITISGEVRAPGVYPALGVRKLQDVVVAAGGVSQAAASKVIITRKDDPAHPLTVDYNPEALKPVIPDIQIFPGDSILVPRAGIVYVVGNVQRSGGYVLDGRNQLTVEEALALAGGSSHAPDLRHVQLVRTLDDGRKEMITLPVNRIIKGRAPDVAMVDGDILYVPTSNLKLASEQAINDMVSLGTSFILFRATTTQ
ncbi:MAG: polysaccharide biosynthesis/export family protein [Terracidiphilus sp.]